METAGQRSSMSREAMQMALEALEQIHPGNLTPMAEETWNKAITAMRQALETDLARVGEVGVWVECESQEALEDGWCDWVCPKPQGYLMQCCDCGLIHEVESRVAKYEPRPSEVFEVVDDPDLQVQWRMKRRDDISPKKPHQEPVAWISEGGDVSRSKRYMDEMGFKCNPLYAAPPKQWVGLADEEREFLLHQALRFYDTNAQLLSFIKTVEEKLKEKNT